MRAKTGSFNKDICCVLNSIPWSEHHIGKHGLCLIKMARSISLKHQSVRLFLLLLIMYSNDDDMAFALLEEEVDGPGVISTKTTAELSKALSNFGWNSAQPINYRDVKYRREMDVRRKKEINVKESRVDVVLKKLSYWCGVHELHYLLMLLPARYP